MFSLGGGWKKSTRYFRSYTNVYDSAINKTKRIDTDSSSLNWLNIVLDYRAGVLRKYPFGKGLEIGYHMESAFRWHTKIDSSLNFDPNDGTLKQEYDTTGYPEGFSPPLLEIETRFGFPDYTLSRCIFHHNMSLGWITGQYVDNGWFAGYSAGWEFSRCIPFVSTKLMLTGTDKLNSSLTSDLTFFNKHERTFVGRVSGGASLLLPSNYSFIPEYITPELSIMYPNFSHAQPLGVSFSVGIRWLLGQ